MKAIVANVLFGGIFGCLNYANSTGANPAPNPESSATNPLVSTSSTPLQTSIVPQRFNLLAPNFVGGSLYGANARISIGYKRQEPVALTGLELMPTDYLAPQLLLENDCSLGFCSDEIGDRLGGGEHLLATQKQYIHRSPSASLVLGFQNTFWSNEKQGKYWGITTVEQWGNSGKQLNLQQLDYLNSAPILATGGAALTFSGGGNRNLAAREVLDRHVNADREFEDFRGGVTYHQGVAKQLTMGVGFVYEETFAGFAQLTYDSDLLPIATTLSLISQDDQTDLHSHIRFQPSSNFTVNYHHDGETQKFDANLGVYPGLTLIAKGNSKQDNYSTGIKVAVQNNYFSLTATAALDRERNLQWSFNSQIGSLKLVHSSSQDKTDTELSNQLLSSEGLGFQCSAFVKYQSRQVKQQGQEFTVWGGRVNSPQQIAHNRHQWNLDLGYGTSPHGGGWIAKGSVALKSDLFLDINYQEISAVSDETKFKLELGSR